MTERQSGMPAITIDDRAKFVSVLSVKLDVSDVAAVTREVQNTAEGRAPKTKGFIGCIVMLDKEASELLVVSAWESSHAWGAAQWDKEIGQVVSDVVETAESYSIQTYETVTVVRA